MRKVFSSDRKISSFRRELFLRRLAVAGFIAVPLALIIGTGFFIYRYEGFRISSVGVSGNVAVPSEEIITASGEMAAGSFWGKILGGDHRFAWSAFSEDKLKDRIFRLADVSSAIGDERHFSISVSERKEEMIWCFVREEGVKDCFWLDGGGNLFAPAPDAEGSLIMVVNDGTGRPLGIKDRPLRDEELDNLNDVFELVSGFGWVISGITIADVESGDLDVDIHSGQKINFNLNVDPSFGKAVMRSLIDSGEWNLVEYLDLRVDGKGFYKLK